MELVKGPTYSHEEMLAHMVAEYEVILLRTCYMYLHDKALAEDATHITLKQRTQRKHLRNQVLPLFPL